MGFLHNHSKCKFNSLSQKKQKKIQKKLEGSSLSRRYVVFFIFFWGKKGTLSFLTKLPLENIPHTKLRGIRKNNRHFNIY